MTMTHVEIGHGRPARSPDTKAAVAYLAASGAVAISIVEIDGVCTIRTGNKILPDAAAMSRMQRASRKYEKQDLCVATAWSLDHRKHTDVPTFYSLKRQ